MSLLPFIITIPQGHCSIIEMFGKPSSVKKSGMNFLIPFVQSPKDVSSLWTVMGEEQTFKREGGKDGRGIFIELSEQILDTSERLCHTKDNVEVKVDCAIRWRITDPIKAVYEVDHLHQSLIEAVLGEVRVAIGNRTMDEVISSRASISEHVVKNILATITRWGIAVSGVEIQKLDIDERAKESMLKQIEAERVSRAIALEAEGKSKAAITLAESEKKSSILRAEGASAALRLNAEAEKEYLRQLAEVVGADNAAKILLTRQTIEGYATISSNPADKVYLPNNVRAVIESSKS